MSRPIASGSYRENWFPKLDEAERAAVLALERRIEQLQAEITSARALRRKLVNKGVSRAAWALRTAEQVQAWRDKISQSCKAVRAK